MIHVLKKKLNNFMCISSVKNGMKGFNRKTSVIFYSPLNRT
jgi:hypothetical protein